MFLPAALLMDSMSLSAYAGDRDVYHIGTLRSIDDGIICFQGHLKKNKQIIIGEPEMVSYLNWQGDVAHVLLFKSVSNLEYLEYLDKKTVDNNKDLKDK